MPNGSVGDDGRGGQGAATPKGRFGLDAAGKVSYSAPSFDSATYRQGSLDLSASLSDDPAVLAAHWLSYGFYEGRPAYGLQPFVERLIGSEIRTHACAITCFGFFDAPSGLGMAARLYRDAFLQAGFDVRTVTVRERQGRFVTEPDMRHGTKGAADHAKTRVNFYVLNADMMHSFFFEDRRHLLDQSYNIAVWYWELTYFPSNWVSSFGPLDEVWVASDFCRKAIEPTSPIPVHLVPPPVVDIKMNVERSRHQFGIPADAFVFGCIFDIGSVVERKNPVAAIRAFRQVYGGRADFVLVLKFHGRQHNPRAAEQLHAEAGGAANILFFEAIMSDADMLSFRNAIDCLVSPHRAEGFGFNAAEMLLMQRSVIATDYSGTKDFVTPETGFPIPAGLREVGSNAAPYPAGALWADPDPDALARAMETVAQSPEEAARRAARGRSLVLETYGLKVCAERIRARLDAIGILRDPPLPPSTWGTSRFVSTPARIEGDLRISVLAIVENTPPELLVACVNAMVDQDYGNWELLLVDAASTSKATVRALDRIRGRESRIKVIATTTADTAAALNTAVAHTSGEVLVLCDADDMVAPAAAGALAAAAADDAVDLIYGDEDRIDIGGHRSQAFHKPDWSPEHLESSMYIGNGLALRRRLFLEIGGARPMGRAMAYDLALRASRRAASIVHIPQILYHQRTIQRTQAENDRATKAQIEALADHLDAMGRAAVIETGMAPSSLRVRTVLPPDLPVTLLIFTDNRSADVTQRGVINLFDHMLDSIEQKTRTSCRLHLLVADNGNLSPAQRSRVAQGGGRVVSYRGSAKPFNFAHKANFAFGHVETEYVVMLNDDMEVITEGWIDALMDLAIRPDIGAVGAKLLFPDDTIQHCGTILGIFDDVAHIYHGHPAATVGYYGNNDIIRNYSAVTGACLATRMSVFREVGGFDEQLAIDYNDIDLCLRIRRAGYRNVYTPFAQLYHFEGKTAQRSVAAQSDKAVFKARWADLIAQDPAYNRNLSRTAIDFRPADR